MVPASITMVAFGMRDSAEAVSCELHLKEKWTEYYACQ
jgi:hypothetical protein